MISFHTCVAIVTKEKDTEWVHRLMTTTMTQGCFIAPWKRSQGLIIIIIIIMFNKYKSDIIME